MGSPLLLPSGYFLPTEPLTVLAAVIHQEGDFAADAVQDLFPLVNPPLDQERCFSPPLGAFHLPNNPSGLLCHARFSLR